MSLASDTRESARWVAWSDVVDVDESISNASYVRSVGSSEVMVPLRPYWGQEKKTDNKEMRLPFFSATFVFWELLALVTIVF